MEKKPIYVAVSTQKGGVGKTTFTVLAASYLHYRMGYNVAVIDCDYPQYSIVEMRKRDSAQVMKNDFYKKMAYTQFKQIDKKAYPVLNCPAEEAPEKIQAFLENSPVDYDVVFFDLPGTANSMGVLRTITQMNYLFSPISADRLILESTLSFMSTLNTHLISAGQTQIKGIHLFWNLVDGREKSELYNIYEGIIEEMELQLMKTFVPDTKRFRKELSEEEGKAVFRSTLFPIDKRLVKGSHLEELFAEMCRIMKL